MIARAPLQFEPGSQWKYGNAGSSGLGRIIEVVGGMPYQDFLQRRILDPPGMRDTTFYPDESQAAGLAKSYDLLPGGKRLHEVGIFLLKGNLLSRRRAPVPGGGLFSTATDMWRFYQMLLDGGSLDGQRILSPEAVAEMTRVQTGSLEAGFSPGMGWGLSPGIVRQPVGWTDALPVGAYGPSVIVEPASQVVMILMIQRGGLHPYADGLKYRQAFQRAVAAALSAPGSGPQFSAGAAEVWSATMRQPTSVRRKSSVNSPFGSPLAVLSRQRPNTTAASGERTVVSRSEKVRAPIAARSG